MPFNFKVSSVNLLIVENKMFCRPPSFFPQFEISWNLTFLVSAVLLLQYPLGGFNQVSAAAHF
jgi:hypothetical protein